MFNAAAGGHRHAANNVPTGIRMRCQIRMIHLKWRIHDGHPHERLAQRMIPCLKAADNLVMPLVAQKWIVRIELALFERIQFRELNIAPLPHYPQGIQFAKWLHSQGRHMPGVPKLDEEDSRIEQARLTPGLHAAEVAGKKMVCGQGVGFRQQNGVRDQVVGVQVGEAGDRRYPPIGPTDGEGRRTRVKPQFGQIRTAQSHVGQQGRLFPFARGVRCLRSGC